MLAAVCSAGAFAQGIDPSALTPDQVAAAIEAQASASSFQKLEQFGRDALMQPTIERLRRLDHVAWIFVNQSDFKRFDTWNTLLALEAAKAHNRRFMQVAVLNGLRSRFDQGDTAAVAQVRAIADADPDWYVRVIAMTIDGYLMERQNRFSANLQRMVEADSLIPDRDTFGDLARSRIWESEALALIGLHDLKASAVAAYRSQIQYERADDPRPDFDEIYNMTGLATQIGDQRMAEDLFHRHHRLVMRSNIAGLDVWDQLLCAEVAEPVSPGKVLNCLKGLDPISPDSKGRFLADRLLPLRAIALAATGDAAGAALDLAAIRALQPASGDTSNPVERLPEVEAAVLHAQGRDGAAYAKLQAYLHANKISANVQSSAGISQLTAEMQKQLSVRRDQLITARRNAKLQHDVIAIQDLLEIVGGAVTFAVFGLLLWQWRVAGQLRRARAAADAANTAKSEFLANMSHEIRTPLNGVVAVADMLTRANLPEKERRMAEIIHASGDTLQRLLSDILDFARIESGKIVLEAAPFDVAKMVRAVAALSEPRCAANGVALRVEIAPGADQTVMGDLVRVRQVVTNLLSNAAKFTEAGEIRLTLERVGGDWMRFTVADTGVGFASADKAKVLGRFEQADSSITRRFGGTGLGLSICGDLARLMGGSLDCDSELGVGSRFWMELPLAVVEVEDVAEVVEPRLDDETGQRPLRILLADDHPTNRKVVELILDGDVAHIDPAENGAEALELFSAERYDLILMDMQMPVMDGLTAVKEIRRREQAGQLLRTPIIMLTANALPEHVAAAGAAGADLHLAKPFTASALFDAIAAALPAAECEIAA